MYRSHHRITVLLEHTCPDRVQDLNVRFVAQALAILTVPAGSSFIHDCGVYRLFVLIFAFATDVGLAHRSALAHSVETYSEPVGQHNAALSEDTLRVFVWGPDGGPIDKWALVILTNMIGEVQQVTAQTGCADFNHVHEGWYDLEIIAAGYERAKARIQLTGSGANSFTVALKPAGGMDKRVGIPGAPILAPKAKKELGKAQEALHAGQLSAARRHLDAVYRLAPGNPDVNYVFAIYWMETNELEKAKDYLGKVLNLDPKHAGALRALGIVFLRENMPTNAVPYFKRAIEAEPTSWRSHALLTEACLRLGLIDESVSQAERALELGHGPAAIVQPLLSRALAERGETDRAIQILQKYVQEHTSDTAATRQLESLKTASQPKPAAEVWAEAVEALPASAAASATINPFLSSSWLPPDIDEAIPPVEPGAPCVRDEVLKKVGERVQEFVSNVNRFTATETITHETINRWGFASSPEKFKYNYVVSIEETRAGLLNVDEFRSGVYSGEGFPDGIVARGLPGQLLVFHPVNVDEFEMACEGLARWNGTLAWQMHFRQRNDRPNTTRRYVLGENGPSYAAALKGRAWIAADSYQILRIESELDAPMPEIRLVADHTVIEYGPVNFRKHAIEMWLPQRAEFFYDWRGHRGHRVHRFSDYLLFSVDDKQRISPPKAGDDSPSVR